MKQLLLVINFAAIPKTWTQEFSTVALIFNLIPKQYYVMLNTVFVVDVVAVAFLKNSFPFKDCDFLRSSKVCFLSKTSYPAAVAIL